MNNLARVDEYKAVATGLIDLGIQYGLSLVSAIGILIAGFFLAGWASRAIRRRLEKLKRFDQTLIPVLSQIARYVILVFTLVLVLSEFGIQTASIIAVLGAAGLAIGLALQGTLQNVAAGLMLLFLRPFKVGDFIETGAGSGTVQEIGMFMTRMRTSQGLFVAVPNSKIWSGSITNYSKLPTRRIDLVVGISYDDDIDKARALILKLARGKERVLDTPEPVVNVTNLGDSSVDLELRAWTKRQDYWEIRWGLMRDVKYALDKAGISIPYPHVQVVRSEA
ncbi:MAG TPA: mechanosensitive ion channel [Rhizobiales bacterium]|nr:mechanosensitive ion channel [Hyphomicrobiales bacterium]